MKYPDIKWHLLSKINKFKFINTMYIWIFVVPVLSRLLEKVGDVANVTIFDYTFEAQLTLPFSWLVFYFSAVSFAIANVIFQIRCPNIIKDHTGYSDFKQANKGVEHLDKYLFQVNMNWEGLRQQIERQDEYFSEVAEVSNPKAEDGMLRKRFWAIFNQGDRIRKISKTFVVIFYAIGFALISYVFVENIVFVTGFISK